jgi:F-type H+-transporting ATPase subunit epsilon
MRVKVLLPTRVLLDVDGVSKLLAESTHGAFGILPRHVDFVAPIIPGILLLDRAGEELVLGVDEGVLVKRGGEVRVSVREAVRGEELGRIRELVTERFEELDERERRARTALARLEASFYRRFIEQERLAGG